MSTRRAPNTTTAYPWGDEIGENNANCNGCGSEWLRRTVPVESFAPNAFGLHDMLGNVWVWAEDCYHVNYDGAPADGSPWFAGGNCKTRVVRGGSWNLNPQTLRSASRSAPLAVDIRSFHLGFRIARTLDISQEPPIHDR